MRPLYAPAGLIDEAYREKEGRKRILLYKYIGLYNNAPPFEFGRISFIFRHYI
jgi:hypothetical protein